MPVIIRAIKENAQLLQRLALILLTRSPCDTSNGSGVFKVLKRYYDILHDTELHGGDIFLLRYEDLYLSGQPGPRHGLDKELDAYIPGFGQLALDMHPGDLEQEAIKIEKTNDNHNHVSMSANQYLQEHFLPRLPYNKYINISRTQDLGVIETHGVMSDIHEAMD